MPVFISDRPDMEAGCQVQSDPRAAPLSSSREKSPYPILDATRPPRRGILRRAATTRAISFIKASGAKITFSLGADAFIDIHPS